MSNSQPQQAPENALSVLLSALPVDVASSIEAGFRVVTHDLLATSNSETPRPTSLSPPSKPVDQITTSTSRPNRRPTASNESERPTSIYTARPTSDTSPSQSTRHPEKSHISPSNTSRPSTWITRPSTTATPPPTSSTVPTSITTPTPTPKTNSANNSPPTAQDSSLAKQSTPSITPEKQNTNGTIAGIATGSAAAVVLLTLIIFFLLRRRRKQRAIKALAAQSNQPYPEVAFLYDPVQSPPRSRSPPPLLGAAEAGLDAGGGVVGSRRESAMTQAQRSSLLAPEVVVMPEGEHLLAPGRAMSRESSPNGIGRGM